MSERLRKIGGVSCDFRLRHMTKFSFLSFLEKKKIKFIFKKRFYFKMMNNLLWTR